MSVTQTLARWIRLGRARRDEQADVRRRRSRQIQRLQIRCDALVDQDFAGSYDAVVKGSGIEFEEIRPYQSGDDVRTIDWRVTARSGKPYVKQFREQRQLAVHLLVDGSGSMAAGQGSCYAVATEAAAIFAWLAAREGDQIGLTLFSESLVRTLPPRGGIDHARRVVRELVLHQPASSTTDLASALQRLCRLERRRGLIVLISDFLCDGLERPLRVAARQHQVIPVIVSDPTEGRMPPGGLVRLRDHESGHVRWIDTFSRSQRLVFQQSVQQQQMQLRRMLAGLDLVPIRLDRGGDVALELRRYFESGGGKR